MVIIDPIVKVALISGLFSLPVTILGYLNRRDTKRSLQNQVEMKESQGRMNDSINGHLTQLIAEKASATKRADHAEGKEEERVEQRERNNPTLKSQNLPDPVLVQPLEPEKEKK